MMFNDLQTQTLKARMQKVNEFGNAYSGAIAVGGLVLTLFLLLRGRK